MKLPMFWWFWTIALVIVFFLVGLNLGERIKVTRVNKVITVIDNPNCLIGRMT